MRGRRPGGTQIDSRVCINGTWKNWTYITLELPPQYIGPSLVLFRNPTELIRSCPRRR